MNGVKAAVFGGSAMILLVLALRLLLKKHLPRGLFPALWCAAAVRLLVPAAIPTRLSVWNLLRAPSAAQTDGTMSDMLLPFPELAAGTAEQTPGAAGIRPMLLVWLVCAALFAAYFVIGYVCMARRFHGTRLAPQPSIDAMLDRFRFSRDPRICVSESRRAPLTFGVFHPTVLLPEDLPVGDARFQLVLAHELAHIRRKDCLRKLLLAACLCLYWWNPLVWLMVWLANRDMELACDETVLRALGPDCRKAYALTLLDMAQRRPKSAPLCSGFAKSGAEERIRAILRFRRFPAWTGICAALLFMVSACVVATQAIGPAAVPEQKPAMQEELTKEAAAVPVREPVQAAAAGEAESREAEPEVRLEEKAPAYIWPLEDADAVVTDTYGYHVHPLTQKESFHNGVDLAAAAGQNVLAVADGTVLDCSYSDAYGYYVTLEHENGVQSQYAHLSEFLVTVGDEVRQGQIIAETGESGWVVGPHLHLSVFADGESVDPLAALAAEAASLK